MRGAAHEDSKERGQKVVTDAGGWRASLGRRLFEVRKRWRHSRRAADAPRTLLMIVGCQRSGTTMLGSIMRRDLDASVFGEYTRLNAPEDGGIRLKRGAALATELAREKAPLVVMKPLVESQRIRALLEAFPEARAVWLYRGYRDVARSNLAFFGRENGIDDLRPIAAGTPGNWRSEHVSVPVQALIDAHFAEDMDPHAAAVLFWIARNHLVLDLDLAAHPRVLLCRYEDLAQAPNPAVQALYRWLGRPAPSAALTRHIHAGSVQAGADLALPEAVDAAAARLLAELDACPNRLRINEGSR